MVQEHRFSHFPIRLGRNPLNDFVVAQPFISQFHAVIELRGGELFVRDLGSKNGLQLPSGPVTPNETVRLASEAASFFISDLLFELTREDMTEQPPASRASGIPFAPRRSPMRLETTKSILLSDLDLQARASLPNLHDLAEDSLCEATLVREAPLDEQDTSVDEPSEITTIKDVTGHVGPGQVGPGLVEPEVVGPLSAPVPMPSLEHLPGMGPPGVPDSPSIVDIESDAVPGVTHELLESLRPLVSLRAKMRPTIARLHVALAEDAEALTPAQRDDLFAWLAQNLPWIMGEPDFRRVAELYGVDVDVLRGEAGLDPPVERIAFEGLRWLAGTFLPHAPSLETEDQVVQFISRIRDTLDVFLKSFIPLRDGHRAFTSEMDLVRVSRSDADAERSTADAVEKGKSVEDVASALLDYSGNPNGAHRAVEGAFADLMIHQIALLQGVMRGVKSLLGELAPGRVESDLETDRAAGKLGLTLGPYRYKELWKVYQRRHGNIDDGESVAFAYVFGPEFARAYTDLIDDAEGRGSGRNDGD
jgi:C-terminal domain of Type VI secretion system FHA protein/FHA domain